MGVLRRGPRRGRKSRIVKNHHALFDGVGGLESMQAMFDVLRRLQAHTASRCRRAAKRPVRHAQRCRHAAVLGGAWPDRAARRIGQSGPPAHPPGGAGRSSSSERRSAGPRLERTTESLPWVDQPGTDRIGAQLSMQQMKAVRHQADIKLNEVLLAVVGGALRRHQVARQGVSGPSLVANVAVSTRRPTKRQTAAINSA